MKTRRRPARPAASEDLLAAALRAQDEGVYIARLTRAAARLEIVFANENFCALTGYPLHGLNGCRPEALHADPAEAAKISRWRRSARSGRPLSGEGNLRRRDGTTLHAAWTLSVIPAARGHPAHVVASYRDTTEKRQLQEALLHAQRLDAVGRLAGGVAHDFNNLLSVINGYCQILAGQAADQPRILKGVEEIHLAGKKAALLTRQLLAFGRRQPVRFKVINLNRFIHQQAGILRRLLGEAGRLELDLDPGIGQVRADPAQIEQVMINLTLNARDALRRNGIVVIGTARRQVKSGLNRRFTDARPGAYVCLSVQDNGTGMSEEIQKQLFEPFFTTKPEGKGTGLGLALVHGVVQRSGGFIQVKSAPAKGSTLQFLLPEVQLPEDALPPPEALEPLPSTQGHETVLLVEEDEVIRKMVSGVLTADGYTVVAVKTPATARRAVHQGSRPVQLLITSLTRPGDRLAPALHAAVPGLRVLSTATPRHPVSLAGLPRSRWAHLPKPYALNTLLQAVRSLLDA